MAEIMTQNQENEKKQRKAEDENDAEQIPGVVREPFLWRFVESYQGIHDGNP